MLGVDFFSHGILFGLTTFFGYRLIRNKPFLFRAIILFCLLNVIGVYYELYQGVVRDWLFDIIANNCGILCGLYLAHRKDNKFTPNIYYEEDDKYLRSSIRRRLSQRKKEI